MIVTTGNWPDASSMSPIRGFKHAHVCYRMQSPHFLLAAISAGTAAKLDSDLKEKFLFGRAVCVNIPGKYPFLCLYNS